MEVIFVTENGAARKAGVVPDDKIVEIDGKCVLNYSHSAVVDELRKVGPFVYLTLLSPTNLQCDRSPY